MISQVSQFVLWFMMGVLLLMQLVVLKHVKSGVPSHNGIPPGMRIPNLQIRSLKGVAMQSNDLLHQTVPTMFCFVSYACRYCREVTPELSRVAKQYSDFRVVLLSTDTEGDVRTFMKETGADLPVYLLDHAQVVKKLKIKNFPFGMLVDGSGVVMRREVVKKTNVMSWLIDVPQYVQSARIQQEVVS